MSRVTANKWSFITAIIVTIIGLLGIYSSSKAIARQKTKLGLIAKSDLIKPKEYRLMQSDKCLAELSTRYEESSEQIAFVIKGSALLKYELNELTVQLSGFAQFNSLRQFTGALLYLRTSEHELKLQADGINKIVFKVTSKHGELTELFRTTINGPLLLIEHDQDFFRLQDSSGIISQLLLSNAKFNKNPNIISNLKLDTGLCTASNKAALDLTPLVGLVNSLDNYKLENLLDQYVKNTDSK